MINDRAVSKADLFKTLGMSDGEPPEDNEDEDDEDEPPSITYSHCEFITKAAGYVEPSMIANITDVIRCVCWLGILAIIVRVAVLQWGQS